MTNEIQEQYKDGHWETIAIATTSYNADVILMALQSQWSTTKFRALVL